MCCQEQNWLFQDPTIDPQMLEPALEQYGAIPGSLITVLQKAQDLFGYLPVDLLAYIAMRMCKKPAEVFGVATFYTQFRLKPAGKHLILLCQGTACHVNGSAQIEQALRQELRLKEGEITPDGLFSYNNVACLGCCSLSPVMMIGSETYGKLTPEKVRSILAGIREREVAR